MTLYPPAMVKRHEVIIDGVLSLERGLWDTSGLQTRLSEEVILREIQEKTEVECRKGESGRAVREKTQIHRIPQHRRGTSTHAW